MKDAGKELLPLGHTVHGIMLPPGGHTAEMPDRSHSLMFGLTKYIPSTGKVIFNVGFPFTHRNKENILKF